MQHRAQKLTTKFLASSLISFSWKNYWNFDPKIIVEWIINKRQPKIFEPTLAQEKNQKKKKKKRTKAKTKTKKNKKTKTKTKTKTKNKTKQKHFFNPPMGNMPIT